MLNNNEISFIYLLISQNNQYYSFKDSSKKSLPLIASIEIEQQNSNLINETENSSNNRVPLYISAIIDMRFVFGEQYAKVVFEGIYFFNSLKNFVCENFANTINYR